MKLIFFSNLLKKIPMPNSFYFKVLTNFSRYGKADIEKFTRTVIENMTKEKKFARFAADVAQLSVVFTDYLNLLKANNANKELSDVKIDDARAELNVELDVVGSYVNGFARGSRAVILEAGFESTTPPEPVMRIGLPVIVKVARTEKANTRELEMQKTEGVKIFQVRYRYDEDTEYQFLCATTKLKTRIGPFEIGRTVWIQVCGLGARDLMTEWTEPKRFVAVE